MSIAQEAAECGHYSDLETIINALVVKVVKGETTVFALRGQYIVVDNTEGGTDIQSCAGYKDQHQRIVESVGLDTNSDPVLNILQITDATATVTPVSCGGMGMTPIELLNLVFNSNPATGQSGLTILHAV
jgi:hypothetical protein